MKQQNHTSFCALPRRHSLLGSLAGILLLLVPLSMAVNADMSSIETSANVGWHSKYISDGREDFGGEGMFTVELGAEYEGFYAGLWFANSDSDGTDETNFFIGKGMEWGDISVEVSYIYLTYGGREVEPGESDDHESEVVVACDTCLPMELTPEIGMVYDWESHGYATWLALSREIESGDITLNPYALVQFDNDYTTPRYDGVNHYEIGMEIAIPVSDSVEVITYAAHAFAGEDIRKEARDAGEDADDETWVGVSLQLAY